MATTITAATIGPVLRDAADWIAGLRHYRVSRNEVHAALRDAAAQDFNVADAALNALAAHMASRGDDPQWLNRHADPRPRHEVAALLRAAAENAQPVTFDWTRREWIVPVQVPRGEAR